MFVLQTDSVSSLRELINIQRNYPISLDPLVFHVLAHACTKIFGPTALALRLPSIFGFLADAGLHLLRDARHRRLACCADCDGLSCTHRDAVLRSRSPSLWLVAWLLCACIPGVADCYAPQRKTHGLSHHSRRRHRADAQHALLRHSDSRSDLHRRVRPHAAAPPRRLRGDRCDPHRDGRYRLRAAVSEGCRRVPQTLLQRRRDQPARHLSGLPVALRQLHDPTARRSASRGRSPCRFALALDRSLRFAPAPDDFFHADGRARLLLVLAALPLFGVAARDLRHALHRGPLRSQRHHRGRDLLRDRGRALGAIIDSLRPP